MRLLFYTREAVDLCGLSQKFKENPKCNGEALGVVVFTP
jgi:hypothetical protein